MSGPGYGQQPPQHGQPANPYGRSPVTYEFGVVGSVVAAVGAILVVIAFTATDWFNFTPSHLGDVKDQLDVGGSAASGLAKAYFGWLGWLLLVVVMVLAIIANIPTPAAQAFRALGGVLAAIAVAITFFAINLAPGISYSQSIKNSRIAFYLALGGLLLAGIGALIGPRRRED